jgi:hypothetical protein
MERDEVEEDRDVETHTVEGGQREGKGRDKRR